MATMYLDVVDLRAFYASRLGQVARRLIGRRLAKRWPSVAGESLIGVGYATPYLEGLAEGVERVVAFMPAAQGVVNWPPGGPNAAALVADDSLPLPDASVDRVLAIHSLEMTSDANEHLREIWRVLAPGGRLIIVVPNRRGIWARVETTPFGFGRPYGRGQLTALLRDALFSPLGWSEALAVPPFRRRPLVRSGSVWEKIGTTLWPAFAGVIIVEATKQLYQGIPARRQAQKLEPAFQPALIPPGASAHGA
jgi:SAM-dependent methyltransferase